MGLIIGFSLFGAVTFLPLFLQVVRGPSPTDSGLQLVPADGGHAGRLGGLGAAHRPHRPLPAYPIVGTARDRRSACSCFDDGPGTTELLVASFMAVLGLGLGMVMQVLVLAVQNDVAYADLGVATSGATLFRSIGGSLGTAPLGAIFTNRLIGELDTGCRPERARAALGEHRPGAVAALPGRCTRPTSTASPAPSPRSSSPPRRSRCWPSRSPG